MENQVSRVNENEVSLTLEQIEVRMDMLIQQTKMHFLEMGKLLDMYIDKLENEECKTRKEAKQLASEKFKMTNNTIENLIKVFKTFGNLQPMELPYDSWRKLEMIAGWEDVQIDNFLGETFNLGNGKEKQGKDLTVSEMEKVLREKKELEKALEEEKSRTEEEKKKLEEENVRKLEQIRKQLEFRNKQDSEHHRKMAEERAKQIAKEQLEAMEIEEKLKYKKELDRVKAKEKELKEKQIEIQNRYDILLQQEKRNLVKEKEVELLSKRASELENEIEMLEIEKEEIKNEKNKIIELKEMFEDISDLSSKINSIMVRDFERYINNEEIKPYVEVALVTCEDITNKLQKAINNNIVDVVYRG